VFTQLDVDSKKGDAHHLSGETLKRKGERFGEKDEQEHNRKYGPKAQSIVSTPPLSRRKRKKKHLTRTQFQRDSESTATHLENTVGKGRIEDGLENRTTKNRQVSMLQGNKDTLALGKMADYN